MEEHLTSDLHFQWGLVFILYSPVSGRSTSQTFMYAGENDLCVCIIDKFNEYPAVMDTANVGNHHDARNTKNLKYFFLIRLTVTRVVIQSLRW